MAWELIDFGPAQEVVDRLIANGTLIEPGYIYHIDITWSAPSVDDPGIRSTAEGAISSILGLVFSPDKVTVIVEPTKLHIIIDNLESVTKLIGQDLDKVLKALAYVIAAAGVVVGLGVYMWRTTEAQLKLAEPPAAIGETIRRISQSEWLIPIVIILGLAALLRR